MYRRNFRRLRNHQGLNYMSGSTGAHALKKQSLSHAPVCDALNTFRDDIGKKKNTRCPTFKVLISKKKKEKDSLFHIIVKLIDDLR